MSKPGSLRIDQAKAYLQLSHPHCRWQHSDSFVPLEMRSVVTGGVGFHCTDLQVSIWHQEPKAVQARLDIDDSVKLDTSGKSMDRYYAKLLQCL